MAYNNRITNSRIEERFRRAILTACFIALGSASFSNADMSYGQVIAQFVTSQFVSSGIFGDIKEAGQGISGAIEGAENTVKGTIPVSQVEDWLQKIRVVTMILKILQQTGAPKHIDLKAYFAVIRQIAASNKDFNDMADEIKSAALDYTKKTGNKDASYTNGGFTAGAAATGAATGLNLVPDNSSSLVSASVNLDLSESNLGVSRNVPQSLNLGTAPSLGGAESKLNLQGGGEAEPMQSNTLLDIMEKFLNLINSNAELISKIGSVVDKIDSVAKAPDKIMQDQISGFIDKKGNGFLGKYGISGSDISAAEDVVDGKYSLDNFDDITQIISMIGKGNSTVDTFGKLVDLYKQTGKMQDISEDTAMKLLIKVVGLVPSAAGAVDSLGNNGKNF